MSDKVRAAIRAREDAKKPKPVAPAKPVKAKKPVVVEDVAPEPEEA